MPARTYAENPLHPVVNDYPSALVPTSLVFDVLHVVTRLGSFRTASFATQVLALVSGGIAARAGLEDYRGIPAGTEQKRTANAHLILNSATLGTVALGLLSRLTGRIGAFALLLNLAANGLLMAGGWFGSRLVYRHGVRVQDVDDLGVEEGLATADADASRPLAAWLEGLLRRVPDTDLAGYAERAAETAAAVGHRAQGVMEEAGSVVGARVEDVRERLAARDGAAEEEPHGLESVTTGLDVAAARRTDEPA